MTIPINLVLYNYARGVIDTTLRFGTANLTHLTEEQKAIAAEGLNQLIRERSFKLTKDFGPMREDLLLPQVFISDDGITLVIEKVTDI